MGIWDKAKSFLNIGGLKVKITKCENPFPINDPVMKGNFVLSTEADKTVLSTSVEFYLEETTMVRDSTSGKEEPKTTKTTLGRMSSTDYKVNTEYPFDLKAGETREISFMITDINAEGILAGLADRGGMLGMVGKAASVANAFRTRGDVKYYLQVIADVKGSPFDPSDRVEIRVVPARTS